MAKISKDIFSKATLFLCVLVFVIYVTYVLHINQEVLYTAHSRSEFLYGSPFFHALMSKPFGLIQYVGAWLTQLFYYPALGAAVLVIIWTLIIMIGIKAFRLNGSASALMFLPVACLLTSVVDLGYWIYVSVIRGYWFSQSIGYLLFVVLLWVARYTPRKWHVVWYVFAVCLYPVLGWFAMLFLICLALSEKLTWRELIGVALLIFMSGIWHVLLYSNLNVNDVMLAGMPRFATASDSTPRLTTPFWILGAVSVFIALCGKLLVKWYVPVLCTIASIVFTSSFMFSDNNYFDEMRMVRYAEDDNWKEVLRVAEEASSPTSTMVMLKNTALMYEGGVLDRAFKTTNDAIPISPIDSLHVSFLEVASPLVYFSYGLTNEAIRLNYECAVQASFSPFYLKQLSRCALAKGDKKLLERYTTILHHHPFYTDWQPTPAPAKTSELMRCFPDEITGVENSDSYIVNSISLWFETDSKLVSEQALFFSMLRRDTKRFWPSLRNYARLHLKENFPLHAQEAYIMYMDKAPEVKRIMLPVEQKVYDRYKQFWATLEELAQSGISKEECANKMRQRFGDTYWYFNVFAKKIY